ncbi:glycerate kinase [Endozoicomonas montiporae]|uniref:Glycerate kinase n=2 Tax=Endozoicomonas montiporae TaxID=1027273 RepID=A0A081N5I7_9GAMM|nr:glycerate kinase [Endozoicomonas montiporae]AMO57400.1 glycerate kinase [Endozoicomonas montiporae CL-33]KEQ13710.1 glycerate kinase [Endozoicomonas montiporae]
MKIVIAPDSFKECLSAIDVATAIETGMRRVLPAAEFVKVPVADGGEGTLQSLVDGTGGQFYSRTVTGPLGEPVEARFGILGDGKTAVIEMAEASGLELVLPHLRNPLLTTSYGTGELIREALNLNVSRIIVAIGGSATNDGGAGMMSALGVRFLNDTGELLPAGGAALADLASIDCSAMDSRLSKVRFTAACDVNNPLTGKTGASAVFGPQKGATPAMVVQLDKALMNYAEVIQHCLDVDIEHVAGAGAAGGMGAALLTFLEADLKPGINIVLETVGLKSVLTGADLLITGEGRLDSQTAHGKTPVGVARVARSLGVPVIALAGSVGQGSEVVYEHGINAVFPVVHGAVTLTEALESGKDNLERTAENIARLLILPGFDH